MSSGNPLEPLRANRAGRSLNTPVLHSFVALAIVAGIDNSYNARTVVNTRVNEGRITTVRPGHARPCQPHSSAQDHYQADLLKMCHNAAPFLPIVTGACSLEGTRSRSAAGASITSPPASSTARLGREREGYSCCDFPQHLRVQLCHLDERLCQPARLTAALLTLL